ncbi:MAG TPA: NTP transferase domain-containing protein [Verrucomicrobiae bacterium]|nr:NTP transferase domain-containing protein [Verrucomicrobiae bacterium]
MDQSNEPIIPHVIIPCAGSGTRFKEQGYQVDKPLIPVGGRRMLDWVLDVIPDVWRNRVITVVRDNQSRLRDELWDWDHGSSVGVKTCIIPGSTQGAACTVLAAAVGLPPDEPVLIMNADQFVKVGTHKMLWAVLADNVRGARHMPDKEIYDDVTGLDGLCKYAFYRWDGFMLTFPGTGPAWSYAVTNGENRVVHVIEKKQVSEHATCGIYFWRKASDLVRSICMMVASHDTTKGEYYLAPSLNHLPLADKDVRIVQVEEFYGLGTPEQVKAFEAKLAEGWRP